VGIFDRYSEEPGIFNQMFEFSRNEGGTDGSVTFIDSTWMMSVVLAYQPHFLNQPPDVQVLLGYSLFPDRLEMSLPGQ
jgi:oleate hydratase